MKNPKVKTLFPAGNDLKPAVTKRLSVGLAASVINKLKEQRGKYLTELSDDSDFYDDESDTSEKRRIPDLAFEAKMEDYYDEEDESGDSE